MVKFFKSIEPDHREWILKQPLFYVASAPLTGAHVNISPKGHPSRTFAILSPNQVAYLDSTGSGVETISHIYENGRVTVMFCSFGRSPRIMRLFCRGRVVERSDAGQFDAWIERMRAAGMHIEEPSADLSPAEAAEAPDTKRGVRAIVVLDVWKVQTSCGFGVPLMATAATGASEGDVQPQIHPATGINLVSDYKGAGAGRQARGDEETGTAPSKVAEYWEDRSTMSKWAAKMTEKDALLGYQNKNNVRSLDGLPGLKGARARNNEVLFVGDLTAWAKRVVSQWEAIILGILIALVSLWALKQNGISL